MHVAADELGSIESLTERVLAVVFEVSDVPGAGFLEKVYERALLRELGFRGIRAAGQYSYCFFGGGRKRWARPTGLVLAVSA